MKNFGAVLCLCLAFAISTDNGVAAKLLLTKDEIANVLKHGPWPLPKAPDPSNRVSGNPDAIKLGRQLFASKALSKDGKISCLSCHNPARSFTDGLPRAKGRKTLDRNTLSLANLRHNRWFGWAGQNDNLWAQSIVPIRNIDELALPEGGASKLLSTPQFLPLYTTLFGRPQDQSEERNLVNIGKALAAFQETINTGRTPFDDFRDALADGDWDKAADYPAAAQRGLAIFVGKGKCSFCHSGPLFSNGEFHDSGVPYFIGPGRVDGGRHGGIKSLRKSRFTLDGSYSDDPKKQGAWAVRQVLPKHADFGTFRTPGLRDVAKTAPYMHNGSLLTLEAVIRHYSEIDLERLHADGEAILAPLNLSEAEIKHLLEFLLSLSTKPPGN